MTHSTTLGQLRTQGNRQTHKMTTIIAPPAHAQRVKAFE